MKEEKKKIAEEDEITRQKERKNEGNTRLGKNLTKP